MTRVSVSPTASEYQAAERAVVARLQRTAPSASIARWGGGLGALLVTLALIALTKAEYPRGVSSNLSVLGTLGVLVVGLAVYFGSISLAKSRISKSLYAEGSKLLRPYELWLSPQALLIESAGSRAQVSWDNIEEVTVTPQCAIVFTASTHALPVPARCFPSAEEFRAFVAELSSLAKQNAA